MNAIISLPTSAAAFRESRELFEAPIQVFSDGSFQLSKSGAAATLLPVEMDDGTEVDTLAWFASNPRKWFRELLVATHLGDQALCHAQFLRKPIRLLATPADWLASPEEAICVLDWRCDLRALFGDVPEVRCASSEMKVFLSRRLAEQVAPGFEITVAR